MTRRSLEMEEEIVYVAKTNLSRIGHCDLKNCTSYTFYKVKVYLQQII